MDTLLTDQIRLDKERRRVLEEIHRIEHEIREHGSIWPRRWALRKAKVKLNDIEAVQQLVQRALRVEQMQMTGFDKVIFRWDQDHLAANIYGRAAVIQT